LENIANTKSIAFETNLNFLKKTESLLQSPASTGIQSSNSSSNFSNQGVNSNNNNNGSSQGNWMGNASSLFKGTSLMKTIKDASSKVIESVQ
jgi:hypothetical protein